MGDLNMNIHGNDTQDVRDCDRSWEVKNTGEWLAQLKRRFDHEYIGRNVSRRVCIYRVPKCMLCLDPDSYLPQVVWLGPYHCNMAPKLSTVVEYKLEAVHRTLKRLNDFTLSNLIAHVQQWENEIREFYDEPIECDGETLAWMFTMDACFILEFFRAFRGDVPKDVEPFSLVFRYFEDYKTISFDIVFDIFKLENQIPLFVLTGILGLEDLNPEVELNELVLPLMDCVVPFDIVTSVRSRNHIGSACHLLDFVQIAITHFLEECLSAESSDPGAYKLQIPLRRSPSAIQRLCCFRPSTNITTTPRVEALNSVGIKLKLSDDSQKIWFEKRGFGQASTLFLPHFNVHDSTHRILRNLMAFEECHRGKEMITRYIMFLSFLITSQKDVGLLREGKVIRSPIGSDEKIADIFKDICQETTPERFEQFEEVIEQVVEQYKSRINLWINQLKEEYCSKPWYIVSLIAGILLLGMSVVQTIYSI